VLCFTTLTTTESAVLGQPVTFTPRFELAGGTHLATADLDHFTIRVWDLPAAICRTATQ
jgi:hypothetical protein